jgi:hypothetical protein
MALEIAATRGKEPELHAAAAKVSQILTPSATLVLNSP